MDKLQALHEQCCICVLHAMSARIGGVGAAWPRAPWLVLIVCMGCAICAQVLHVAFISWPGTCKLWRSARGIDWAAARAAQGLREKKLAQENLDKVDKLKPIAEKLGVPLAQLALAWCAVGALRFCTAWLSVIAW